MKLSTALLLRSARRRRHLRSGEYGSLFSESWRMELAGRVRRDRHEFGALVAMFKYVGLEATVCDAGPWAPRILYVEPV